MKRGFRFVLAFVLAVFVVGQAAAFLNSGGEVERAEAATSGGALYGKFPDYGRDCAGLKDVNGAYHLPDGTGGTNFCNDNYFQLDSAYTLATKVAPLTAEEQVRMRIYTANTLRGYFHYDLPGFTYPNENPPPHDEWKNQGVQSGIKTPTLVMWLAWARLSYPEPKIENGFSTNPYYGVKDGKLYLKPESISYPRSVQECNSYPNSGVGVYQCFNKMRSYLKKNLETVHQLLTVAGIEKSDRSGSIVFNPDNIFLGGDNQDNNKGNRLLRKVKISNNQDIIANKPELLKIDKEYDLGSSFYDGDKFQSFKDFALYYYEEPFTSDLAKKITDLGGGEQVKAESTERCGSVWVWDTFSLKNLKKIICGFVDLNADIANLAVRSSAAFLAQTSGLPGAQASGSIFSWLNGAPTGGDIVGQLTPPQNDNDSKNRQIGNLIRNAHDRLLGLLNTLLIVFFIIIALANILQIQINTYAIKKAVPAVVVGFLLANVAFFAARAVIEVSGYVAQGVIGIDINTSAERRSVDGGKASATMFLDAFSKIAYVDGDPTKPLTIDGNESEVDLGKVFQQVILTIAVFIGAVLLFILGFLFMARTLVLYFLIPFAPIAAFSMNFPAFAHFWKRWYSTFISWVFMPVVAFFWIWLASVWFDSVQIGTGMFASMMGYFFGIVMLFFAIKTPFSMAGEASALVNKWNQAGKKAWASTGGEIGREGKAFLKSRTSYGNVTKAISDSKARREKRLKEADELGPGAYAAARKEKKIDKLTQKNEQRLGKINEKYEAEKQRIEERQAELKKKEQAGTLTASDRRQMTELDSELSRLESAHAVSMQQFEKVEQKTIDKIEKLRSKKSLSERLDMVRNQKNTISEANSKLVQQSKDQLVAEAERDLATGTGISASRAGRKRSRTYLSASVARKLGEAEAKNASNEAKARVDANYSTANGLDSEVAYRASLAQDAKQYGKISEKKSVEAENLGHIHYVLHNPTPPEGADEFTRNFHSMKQKNLAGTVAANVKDNRYENGIGSMGSDENRKRLYSKILHSQSLDLKSHEESGHALEAISDLVFLANTMLSSSKVDVARQAAVKLSEMTGESAIRQAFGGVVDREDLDKARSAFRAGNTELVGKLESLSTSSYKHLVNTPSNP